MSSNQVSPAKQLTRAAPCTSFARIGRIFAVLILFVALMGGSALAAQAATEITFTAEELLGKPTNNSVTINIVPNSTIEYHYQYRPASESSYSVQTGNSTATAGQPHEIVISGLAANIKYYYRMRYHAPGDGPDDWFVRPEHSFWTQRAPGSEFKFTIISDSHAMYNAQYQQAIANIASDAPDFHFDLGDTFMTDSMTTQTAVNNAYLAQRDPLYMDGIGHSIPIFLASGNHENEEGWNLDDAFSIALASIQARKLYYPTPIDQGSGGFYSGNTDSLTAINAGTYGDQYREDYYAWEWGDALFIVFDPFQYTMLNPYGATAGEGSDDPANGDRWNWTLGLQQYNWLKQTLESSTAKYKFMFAHHMLGGTQNYVRGGAVPAHMFEWGGYNADGTTWGFTTQRPTFGADPIRQLMMDNGVSAFFHGHDHQYAYEVRDGIVYLSMPRPSTGLDFNYYSEGDPYTERVLGSPGHLRITVTPALATAEYVTSNGTSAAVQHSFTIAPNVTHDLTMAVNHSEYGTTDPAVGIHSYVEGTVVSITAAANAGYEFSSWTGEVANPTSASTTVTMNTDKTVTANLVEDVTAPTVTINRAEAQADPTTATPINFSVVFSEPVTGFAAEDVDLSASTALGLLSSVVTGSGASYNVAVSGMTGSGDVIASIPAGAAGDAAGHPSEASTSTDNAVSFNLDTTPPTVTINQAAGQADPASTAPVNFTVVFSEPVTGFATGDVTLSASTAPGVLSGVVTGSGASYHVAVSGMTGSGDVVASIAVGAAQDAAGNPSAASTSSDNSVAYEHPAATIAYVGDVGSATNNVAGTSLQIPVGSAGVAAGNFIVVGFASRGAATYNQPVVTDSAGNTYNLAAVAVTYQHGRSYIFYAHVRTALVNGNNITITTSSVASRVAVASVFSGIASISPLDQALGYPVLGANETAQGNSPSVGPTGVTSQPNELIIGMIGTEEATDAGIGTWLNDFQTGPQIKTSGATYEWRVSLGYKIVSATGGFTAAKTVTNNPYWAASIATFKTLNVLPSDSYSIVLGRPTGDSITVNAILELSGQAYLEWGTTPGSYTGGQTTPVAVAAGDPIEVVIDELDPNTQYYYRLQFLETGAATWIAGSEHSFHTQRPHGGGFTFTITSDSHLGQTFSGNSPARYEQTTLNVAADDPEFHLDLGDAFIMNATNQSEANAIYDAQRPYFGNFSHSAPVFLAIGNHENEEGWNLDDVPFSKALGSIIARKEYFPNPVPDGFYTGNGDLLNEIGGDKLREDYYAWEWGDALFVVLDPFQYTMTKPYGTITGSGEDDDETVSGDQWNWTLGQDQFDWFKQTLENSNAKFKFVFAHHVVGGQLEVSGAAGTPSYVRGGALAAPYFEWGGKNADDSWGFTGKRTGWGDDPIHQLMVDNHVSAFFHGHDHQFVHELIDGIVYQLVPSPGMTGYGFDLYDASPYVVSGGNLPSAGHVRVTVSPEEDEALVEYVRSAISGDTGVTNGQVAHTYTIAPPACSLVVPEAVSVAIELDALDTADVLLNWEDDPYNTGGYQIYSSPTPYFTPDESTKLGSPLAAGTTSFRDEDAAGVGGTSYYYIVQSRNCDGSLTADSTSIAVFNFTLTPGS